uniref:Uncharacterized protein n=1 Tax=viral metagenome TaxID=1070528 RepID=A0A6C0JP05_9ZZZZ
MFIVRSLPQSFGSGKVVYTLKFWDNRMMVECSDGTKSIQPMPASFSCRVDQTQDAEVMIVTNGTHSSQYVRFPIGTYDKILENLFNFKGGDLLIL